MKIAFVGPGNMSIPPKGWGAVETIIDIYSRDLERRGVEVKIFNFHEEDKIVAEVNAFAPDFVHCHFDNHIGALTKIACPKKAITSHYGYLDQVWRFPKYVSKIHERIIAAQDVHIFALSESIADVYRSAGVPDWRIRVLPNGVEYAAFAFQKEPKFPGRSLCLGQINKRKRQAKLQAWDLNIDFVGPIASDAQGVGFNCNKPDWIGEWSRDDVRQKMTDYANLVLLSDGEAHALVCMEAMAAGLGLVVSEWATANLDLSLPFVDVIPESRINNRAYIAEVVEKNRKTACAMRDEIRSYARTMDWSFRIDEYMQIVEGIIKDQASSNNQVKSKAAKKVAILTTATGPYFDMFFKDFERSVFDVLRPTLDPTIFCFTDRTQHDSANTKLVPVKHLGWPFASMMRFHFMQELAKELRSYDFVFAMDSDMSIMKPFEPEFFDENFIAVMHPSFFKAVHKAPFEVDAESEAYVPPKLQRHYVQGCFFGAKPVAFNYLTKILSDMVARDVARGAVPVWHDETYLNWFFANHAFKPVSPAYALPEGTRLQLDPFVIHREKKHHEVRSTEAVLDWSAALDPSAQGPLVRQMYLRAHEKTQRLERRIVHSKSILAVGKGWIRNILKKTRS